MQPKLVSLQVLFFVSSACGILQKIQLHGLLFTFWNLGTQNSESTQNFGPEKVETASSVFSSTFNPNSPGLRGAQRVK